MKACAQIRQCLRRLDDPSRRQCAPRAPHRQSERTRGTASHSILSVRALLLVVLRRAQRSVRGLDARELHDRRWPPSRSRRELGYPTKADLWKTFVTKGRNNMYRTEKMVRTVLRAGVHKAGIAEVRGKTVVKRFLE